jgi:hypothetical protein
MTTEAAYQWWIIFVLIVSMVFLLVALAKSNSMLLKVTQVLKDRTETIEFLTKQNKQLTGRITFLERIS